MGVLSLPRAFVFRSGANDPHPIPWIRVKLACAIGDALYPDPQWRRLSNIWSSFYPLRVSDDTQRRLFGMLEQTMPTVVDLIANYQPPGLQGQSLVGAMPIAARRPEHLRTCYRGWRSDPTGWRSASPTLAFAVIAQARADGLMSPEGEGQLLAELLAYWALRTTIDTSEACAIGPVAHRARRAPPVFQPFALGVA
jgi:hypothetical protein